MSDATTSGSSSTTTTADLLARGDAHNSPTYRPAPLIMDHGQGVWLYDRDGNEYLDFVAGIAVNALGYNHPRLVETIREQSARLIHVSNMFYTAEQIALMDWLTAHSVGDRVFLCNSGTEANEAALKLARRYQKVVRGQPERVEFITLQDSFHGRSYGSISATGQPKYHKGFEPMLPGFRYGRLNDLESVEALVSERTAAIMVEPIQGEGGVRPATDEFLLGLRALCDEHGLVLIYDEVQTGVGRTGKLWCHEWTPGAEPDVFTLAKSLGGGFPVGAMLAREEVFSGFERGSHASTFGGNPLGSAAALCVLRTLEEDGLLEHAQEIGALLGRGLEALQGRFPELVRGVRGRGMIWGMELGAVAGDVALRCREEGLLVNTAGGDTLRMVPPLILDEGELAEGLRRLERVLEAQAEAR